MNLFTWKETLEDEERGGDGLRGVEVEELYLRAGPELAEGVGGGGEGRPHSAQVPQWFSFSSEKTHKVSEGNFIHVKLYLVLHSEQDENWAQYPFLA